MENFKVSLHSWQKAANPSILWRPSYCHPPPFFQILSNTPPLLPLPCHFQPSLSLFFLLPYFFGWMGDLSCFFGWMGDLTYFFGWMGDHAIWCAILPNDNMDLHISSLDTLVPESLDVCFMQQGTKFTEIWHLMWLFTGTLIWYHTHKNRHTPHSGTTRLTHPIFSLPVLCSQQLPLLN